MNRKAFSNKEIDAAFAAIERNFDEISKQHKEELEEAFIQPIHELYPYAQNGITALIASMGAGKSYNYLKMIAKSECIFTDPFYELVVICSTSAKFDKTVETYKRVITKSKLVCVEDSLLLAWLNKYMRRILKYNSINDYIQHKLVNDELQRIFIKHNLNETSNTTSTTASNKSQYIVTIDHQNIPTISYTLADDSGLILNANDRTEILHLQNVNTHKRTHSSHPSTIREDSTFYVQRADTKRMQESTERKRMQYCIDKLAKYKWKTVPHRCLLILDDFASHPLLKSKESDLSRLMKKLRHFNINIIICVQTVKSIPKDLKRTLSDLILFPGISYDDFMDLMRESPAGMFDRKRLYDEYSKLVNPHDMFVIHIKAARVCIHPSRLMST